jgi:acyl-CoA synthetase (NDP forming)
VDNSHELDRLFFPKSIAVVGATPKNKQIGSGNMFIEGAFRQRYQGNIYPINPDAEQVLGYKAYPSVQAIPGEVDLVIFAIPLSAVLPVMKDCAAKGVGFVHMFTAGFSETGRIEHAEIERKVLEIARKNNIRIVGPNCMGIYCPEGGVSFQPQFPSRSGSTAIISQSGSLVNDFVEKGTRSGLYFSKIVSFGNASDLQPHEFLQYLAQDEKTGSIGAYIEGLKDGRSFFDVARRVTRDKPLVVVKGGQTEGGSRATMSHTAAIAGSPAIWRALCKQAGIISVSSTDELILTLATLQRPPMPSGPNVAIFGEFGGGSVLMTDEAEAAGLKVPRLAEETIRRLEEFIPLEGHSVKNPLDAGTAIFNKHHFIKLMKVLREDPGIDALIFIQQIGFVYRLLGGRAGVRRFCQMTLEAKEIFNKPIFIVLERDDSPRMGFVRQELEEDYRRAGMATFPSFSLAARVLHNLYQYRKYLDNL